MSLCCQSAYKTKERGSLFSFFTVTASSQTGKSIVNKTPEQLVGATVCWLVGCVTSQQHSSVSQGRICSDNFTCCHTEREVADPSFYLTQSQYTDTGPTSPSADPITLGAWLGSHRFEISLNITPTGDFIKHYSDWRFH